MKTNTFTWIILITLTATSFSIAGKSATLVILAAAGIKSALVGWQFMELRTAHPIWKTAFALLLVAILAMITILSGNGNHPSAAL